MVGRIKAPKGVHMLILNACESVTLRGKRDVIKSQIWRWGAYPGLSEQAQ